MKKWKVELLLLAVLFPVVLFNKFATRPLVERALEEGGLSDEIPSAYLDFAMLCTTVGILNVGALRFALVKIGPKFFPPETLGITVLKAGGICAFMGLLVEAQEWKLGRKFSPE